MSETMIKVNDVTMRFHMNTDRIMSLKEFSYSLSVFNMARHANVK